MKDTEEINAQLPNPENPTRFTGLQLGTPKDSAAGLPAIVSSVQHMLQEMGPLRAWKALKGLNQKGGHTCPGCAWPDPDDERSQLGEYCENGAKAIAEEATMKRIDATFFSENSVFKLSELSDYEIGKKGRLAEPVYLEKGSSHYKPISWEKAFQIIAEKLNACNPDEAVFYTSGRTSNEAAFLYQLFVRQYGTNNLPDCSNMCHESSGVALTESLGFRKGSVTLEDFYNAEVIIILGQNPGTNHPRMLTALKKAKEKGCIIISINPLPEAGLIAFSDPQTVQGILGATTKLTDYFLQVKINGDMALLQAIEKLLLEKDAESDGKVFDHDFIQAHTEGFDALINHLKEQDAKKLAETSGVDIDDIKTIVEVLAGKSKIIACWAMGLTQHKNSVDTIKEVVNLLLLKGSIGKPGAGTCPVRGHSNVQGDRTMGIYENPSEGFINALNKSFNLELPKKAGYDTVKSIRAMKEGKVKVFVAIGGNFLSASPDTEYTAEAIRNCALTVQVSTKLNRSHLVTGEEALILPTLGRSDKDVLKNEIQFVTTENSMGVVQMSKGSLEPVSQNLLSEPVIVTRLAKEVLGNRAGKHWDKYLEHYDNIRDDIARSIDGFEDYNRRVRIPGGFYLPNVNREGQFITFTGKAAFNVAQVTTPTLNDNEYIMMTIRSHDQFNTTIYGLDDRYRGVYNERRVIFMNEKDMTRAGLSKEDQVDIYNFDGGIERVARKFIVIPYSIPEKCTATYFPETNVLVPISSTADKSNTPTSKTVKVELRKRKSESK